MSALHEKLLCRSQKRRRKPEHHLDLELQWSLHRSKMSKSSLCGPVHRCCLQPCSADSSGSRLQWALCPTQKSHDRDETRGRGPRTPCRAAGALCVCKMGTSVLVITENPPVLLKDCRATLELQHHRTEWGPQAFWGISL